jgi:hypothetical protein
MKEIERGTASPTAGQPPGTDSVMVEYRTDAGRQLAVAHFYQRQDGTIVGRADPKLLRFRTWLLSPFRSQPVNCPGCGRTHN